MCTSQMVRVVDLRRIDRHTGKQQTFITGGNIDQIRENFGNPTRYIIQTIPCGYCMECRMQYAQEWAFRCMKEAKEYSDNVMITLTYDDENIPKGKKIDHETGEVTDSYTLDHRDVQLFVKKLRKHFTDFKIKLYGCGEYGSDKDYIDWKGNIRQATERPHYHIIFFNLKVVDMVFWKMSKCEWSKEENPLFKSKTISKLWNKGHVDLNEVNYETCKYVAGYVMKKWKGRGSDEHYMLKGQKPPYTFMSRRPGIGYAFYFNNKDKFENEATFWQVTKKGLKEVRPGRYFDKLLEKDNPECMADIKCKRQNKSFENWKSILQQTDIHQHEYIDNKISKNATKQRFQRRRG